MSTCEPVILPQYRELYKQDTDIVGWIKIGGTEIDYPVMYTADDFYLSHGFNKEASKSGVPFIDKRCSVEPFGTNTIIYGHHMKNGTMFGKLFHYQQLNFIVEHPVIQFDTLYQLGAYVPGHDAELDAAVRAQPAMMAMLQQDTGARATLGDSLALLRHITRH